MFRSLRLRHGLTLLFSLVLISSVAAVALAQTWNGSIETTEGVEYVMNPKEAMEKPLTLTLEELWRLGGDSESEDEFFGVISRITADAEDNVYILDRQLSEVKVFSADGEYIRTIGREGEGPGEFRQPLDMFLLGNGNVGVMQNAPGRVVMLTPQGEPVGDHPLPEDESGAPPQLIGGNTMGNNLLLNLSRNQIKEGQVDITRALTLVAPEGEEKKVLLQSTRVLEFVNFLFDETVWITFDSRFAVASDGYLYAANEYLPYEILVWDPEGNKKRVISREYEHRSRSEEQKKEMYDIFDALLQNQLPQYKIKVSKHDPDVSNVYPRDDGTLWVLTSRGSRDQPEGSLGVFDVFDPEGRFLRQVTLMGDGEPIGDGYFFLGDRFFVVTDLLEANIASRGGRTGEEEEEMEEPEPIAIICYSLGNVAEM